MCGRIGRSDLSWREIYEQLRAFLNGAAIKRVDNAPDLGMSWNVKPTQPVEIVYTKNEELISTPARWWFVPHWFKGDDVKDWKQTTFNARIETADQKPTFRTAWAHHRCIIPANGYYEWTGDKGKKQPYWITTQRNDPALFFAGLYSQLPSGLHTCTILTREALPQIQHIHNRTPVMLFNDEIGSWMDGGIGSAEAKNDLGTGWDGRMQFHEVAPFKRDDDDPVLIEPIQRLV